MGNQIGNKIWKVETELPFNPHEPSPIRKKYIEALGMVIAELKREILWNIEGQGEGETYYVQDIPTIIYGTLEKDGISNSRTVRLTCFADRRDFVRLLKREED